MYTNKYSNKERYDKVIAKTNWCSFFMPHSVDHYRSGGATPECTRSNDLAGRSTALAQALAPPCLSLRIALLR